LTLYLLTKIGVKEKEIPLETVLALISDFKEMGASKLTIMGGEPTLYGISQNHIPLLKVINEAKKIGYEYVRIDTNGQFDSKLLMEQDFKKLDEITFSLDGPIPRINDPVRGKGVFNKCVSNIKKALELGYNVDITCCIHKELLKRNKTGILLLDSMIHFAETLGVNRINFHDLFKTGIPRDTWTGNLVPPLEEWIEVYKEIQSNIERGKYKIPVRIPQCFVTREEFEENPEYYSYCPVKMGERALIHPNGIIRICSLMIGTPYGVARFYDNKIIWDESPTNELRDHNLNQDTSCTNQNKSKPFGKFVPLCVSFKPKQKEFIWTEKLDWESKSIII
jgi:MoaA/NifB/PqqE/SkfB family radical SAM enzyme